MYLPPAWNVTVKWAPPSLRKFRFFRHEDCSDKDAIGGQGRVIHGRFKQREE